MSLDGAPVAQMAALSSFSEYTLIDMRSCVKVDPDLRGQDLPHGCCVGTGWGSAAYLADLRPGDTAIVMGIGGNWHQRCAGCCARRAQHVIAVDPIEFKREAALKVGATHAFATMDRPLSSHAASPTGRAPTRR